MARTLPRQRFYRLLKKKKKPFRNNRVQLYINILFVFQGRRDVNTRLLKKRPSAVLLQFETQRGGRVRGSPTERIHHVLSQTGPGPVIPKVEVGLFKPS